MRGYASSYSVFPLGFLREEVSSQPEHQSWKAAAEKDDFGGLKVFVSVTAYGGRVKSG
jgi:hypothetical protein